jgi:hypothetical protein
VAGGRDPDEGVPGGPIKASPWQRFLLALPRLSRQGDRAPLGERLRGAVLKPAEPGQATAPAPKNKPSVSDLEEEVRSADDKERLVGLLAAPFAAGIAIIVSADLVTHDPAARLANGLVNPKHVNPSVYHTLEVVLLVLAVAMLASAWFRKRLILGIAMALYDLGVFNLHYWGFGIPYILGAAWLMVRAYRLSRDLREATARPTPGGATPGTKTTPAVTSRRGAGTLRRGANKRYTPPPPPTKRPGRSKPEGEKRAG